MDEKAAVALNALNLGAKLQKQIAKRTDAPAPTGAALDKHFATVAAPAVAPTIAVSSGSKAFFDAWDQYYPRIVSLLGWASWVIPGPALTVIKSLLAVMNNEIVPILKQIMK